jgi:hypothetical protein
MAKFDITRPRLVAALGIERTTTAAAHSLGFAHFHGLHKRMRAEGLRVSRHKDITIVEDRRP